MCKDNQLKASGKNLELVDRLAKHFERIGSNTSNSSKLKTSLQFLNNGSVSEIEIHDIAVTPFDKIDAHIKHKDAIVGENLVHNIEFEKINPVDSKIDEAAEEFEPKVAEAAEEYYTETAKDKGAQKDASVKDNDLLAIVHAPFTPFIHESTLKSPIPPSKLSKRETSTESNYSVKKPKLIQIIKKKEKPGVHLKVFKSTPMKKQAALVGEPCPLPSDKPEKVVNIDKDFTFQPPPNAPKFDVDEPLTKSIIHTPLSKQLKPLN